MNRAQVYRSFTARVRSIDPLPHPNPPRRAPAGMGGEAGVRAVKAFVTRHIGLLFMFALGIIPGGIALKLGAPTIAFVWTAMVAMIVADAWDEETRPARPTPPKENQRV